MAVAPLQPTAAERSLGDLFQSRAGTLTAAPLDAMRRDAFARLSETGLPHRRVEAYRYTDLKARLRTLPPAAGPLTAGEIDAVLAANPPLTEGAARVVIANGTLSEAHSSAPGGVRLTSILAPEAGAEGVGALVAGSDDALTLANISLFEGGAVLRIDGIAGGPVEIVHIMSDGTLTMGRVAVFLADGAQASVVERFIGGTDGVGNHLAEITLGAGASLEWSRVIEGASDGTALFSTHHLSVAANVKLEHLTISTGAGLNRNQIFAHVHGDDAETNFRAATVAVGKRHADNTLVMRHNSLDSRSSEVFRSAVGSGGTAIVQGRIIVDPGAQKTDAKMMSNALYLDDDGEVVNKPELEIFADDVQCGHGATSGDLDEEPVFYLRARGIPLATARQMLVEAFLVEALDKVSDEALAETFGTHLRAALGAALGMAYEDAA